MAPGDYLHPVFKVIEIENQFFTHLTANPVSTVPVAERGSRPASRIVFSVSSGRR